MAARSALRIPVEDDPFDLDIFGLRKHYDRLICHCNPLIVLLLIVASSQTELGDRVISRLQSPSRRIFRAMALADA